MLGFDHWRTELRGLIARKEDNPTGFFGVSLKHGYSVTFDSENLKSKRKGQASISHWLLMAFDWRIGNGGVRVPPKRECYAKTRGPCSPEHIGHARDYGVRIAERQRSAWFLQIFESPQVYGNRSILKIRSAGERTAARPSH
jgi:hypothetical protein